ncbi:hypothetical protein [Methanoplanus limicola]|uniref:Uncharacterized protein n=1 Tax=Methanoplanus limicola DSM 2279 TaxID=937775 RepID=H1Z1J4_9EURY|nr:hypothetical protein [Methanoplanus limicola]EHQ36341.1 hypothetical protein Metlim_2284 [Methanoplanus limicola DSM 2279]
MNIINFLQSLSNLKTENIHSSGHFITRFEERKDDSMPDIKGNKKLLICGEPVASSKQDEDKFEVIFNLNENYDLALVVSVKNTNPEII